MSSESDFNFWLIFAVIFLNSVVNMWNDDRNTKKLEQKLDEIKKIIEPSQKELYVRFEN